MCGISGYRTKETISPFVLPTMLRAIEHRGPDSIGTYFDADYSGGMCRLAINDLENGDQPLYNEDKTVSLLYNGEIYNAPELRAQLEAKGYKFYSHSDGEVICHLYNEYQENLFEYLDGMFAIALWIAPLKRLILARDIPGEKPLYYAKLPHSGIAFSSEIKSLKRFPGLDLSLNRQALWDFPTFLWIPEPNTVYQKINALRRGHLLISDDGGIQEKPYANNFNTKSIVQYSDQEIIAETRSVIENAVQSRLLSDVSVGCFLSSGLDSSIITALASKSLDQLNTFTIGFEDLEDPYHGRSDESQAAANFASHLGTRHKTIRVTSQDFYNSLDKFVHHGDQPFAVSSGLGILAVAAAAQKENIKVLLSGDGADECFGGYSWYDYLSQANEISNENSYHNETTSFQNIGETIEFRLNSLAGMSPQKRAWAWHYYAHESEKLSLFSDDYSENLSTSLRHFTEFNRSDTWTTEEYISQDRNFYFPNEMMRKLDRMTMAYSVEGRVPFAAPAVLAHADKLKSNHMVRDGQLKWALRQAFSDILPDHVINQPKHGFNVPIDNWLKTDWNNLIDETFSDSSALKKYSIIGLNARNVARRMLNDPKRLNGHTLFCFVVLNRWLENEYG
jgi:asparagine synthase (glutamine-hydrolysing)